MKLVLLCSFREFTYRELLQFGYLTEDLYVPKFRKVEVSLLLQ